MHSPLNYFFQFYIELFINCGVLILQMDNIPRLFVRSLSLVSNIVFVRFFYRSVEYLYCCLKTTVNNP